MPDIRFSGGNDGATIDQNPEACPYCRFSISAVYITAFRYNNGRGLDCVYLCPREECERVFVARYLHRTGYRIFDLNSTIPVNPAVPEYPKEVAVISPQFTKIFTQASRAEAFELDEIAGVGYRKALEFLIKDYCAGKHPGKEDEIKSRPLGQVIKDFVDNENVKQCAKRAVWLGNDETHYVRTWIDRDVQDLKGLIKLTVGWIEHELITAKILAEMDKPR